MGMRNRKIKRRYVLRESRYGRTRGDNTITVDARCSWGWYLFHLLHAIQGIRISGEAPAIMINHPEGVLVQMYTLEESHRNMV